MNELADRVRGKQHAWEAKWSDPDYSAPWMTDDPPEELRRTVLRKGFPEGGAILDIGCGNGTISAWLAQQPFSVLGVDFSRAAIAIAKRKYSDTPNLKFETLDVCAGDAAIGPFDGLFDRGCLHTMSPDLAEQYATNVAGWSRQGALFLLIYKTTPWESEPVAMTQQRARRFLGRLFRPWFALKGIRQSVIRSHAPQHPNWQMPSLSIWMERK